MMKFSTTEIQKETVNGPYLFSGEVDVSEIATWKNDIKATDVVQVDGMCTVDNKEFIFYFTVEGTMVLPCARTLVDVPYTFRLEATEVFSMETTLTEADEENDIHLVT